MRYSQFIKVDEKFQASINLQFDLNKLSKINSYIPTEQSVEILDRYLRAAYYDSTDRATVLIGPYGRGKSHLILTLLAIMSLREKEYDEKTGISAKETLGSLCDRIGLVNEETASLAKEMIFSSKPILPVIINSNYGDANQAFLMAIKEALRNEGLLELLPETYFDSALVMVDKWEKEFPEALVKFKKELSNYKTNIKEIKTELKRCSSDAYLIFKNCYPAITSGTEFNPLVNTDIIKLYNSINLTLCEQKNYGGMFIVFDEFSKFLEANLDKRKAQDLKIIQDMAELATRSGTNQIHFICVTHKEILDYSTSDSFRTVEGRFSPVRFIMSSEQNYELIANAIIKKKEEFKKFKNTYQDAFKNVKDTSHSTIFHDIDDDIYDNVLLYGCYPLLPISSYALLRVSEKVAQNERTLFTFLSKDENNTLKRFINIDFDGASFLTIDWIYDYFESLFKKEVFNKSVHSIWSKSVSAIKQANDENQVKILKAIAVIGIINDDKLKPISIHIRASLSLSDIDFEIAIESLLKNHIIHHRRTDSHYVFLTANGIDVKKIINDTIVNKAVRIDRCSILSRVIDLGYVLPRRYNDEYSMLRYFKNIFMEAEAFIHIKNEEQLKYDYPYDGLIIHILYDDEVFKKKVIEKVQTFQNDAQIVICLPDKPFSKTDDLKEYFAIQDLMKDPNFLNDDKLLQELQIYEEDIIKSINQFVDKMFSPQNQNCNYYNCDGRMSDISRQVYLNKRISEICSTCYNQTPKINNEMINKSNLSAPIKKARIAIAKALLDSAESDIIMPLSGYGPEVSVFRATIINKGLDRNEQSDDDGLNAIIAEIRAFVVDTETRKRSFEDLYSTLLDKPFGVRKGILPIYIAYVLRRYKSNAIIYFIDKEIPLSADTLDRINDDPTKYYLLLERGTQAKDRYLADLEALFSNYLRGSDSSLNAINRVVACMKNWIRSLPKYSREYTTDYTKESDNNKLSDGIIKLRKELLKFETNPRELLFETIPQQIFCNNGLEYCFNEISAIKLHLENSVTLFKEYIILQTKKIFADDYQGELAQALKNWYDKLKHRTKQHIFDSSTNILLSYISHFDNYNEIKILADISKQVTGLSVEDWNDSTFVVYFEQLNKSVSVVSGFESHSENTDDLDTYKITMTVGDESTERNFTNKDISSFGMTIYNSLESTFDEFNESVDTDEKMAILIKLMQKVIGSR